MTLLSPAIRSYVFVGTPNTQHTHNHIGFRVLTTDVELRVSENETVLWSSCNWCQNVVVERTRILHKTINDKIIALRRKHRL